MRTYCVTLDTFVEYVTATEFIVNHGALIFYKSESIGFNTPFKAYATGQWKTVHQC